MFGLAQDLIKVRWRHGTRNLTSVSNIVLLASAVRGASSSLLGKFNAIRYSN
jgi:hypothetical protein